MTTDDARYHLRRLAIRHRNNQVVEQVMLSAGLALLLFSLLRVTGLEADSLPTAIVVGILSVLWSLNRSRPWKIRDRDIAAWLNKRYPAMEESTDLLIHSGALSSLQTLQREKTLAQFAVTLPTVRLVHKLRRSAVVLALGLATLMFPHTEENAAPLAMNATADTVKRAPAVAALEQLTIDVTPPTYVRQAPFVGGNPLRVPQGSDLRWTARFTAPVQHVWMVWNHSDSLPYEQQSQAYTATRTVDDPAFFQLSWTDQQQQVHRAAFQAIYVTPDTPPQIRPINMEQFVSMQPGDALQTVCRAHLSDDHGLTDAWIIATVSKGSGESVKFREVKLPFSAAVTGQQSAVERTLNLTQLGLEPGDELYYYIVARDNRMPAPQLSRTETFFVDIADTTQQETSVDGGLGVDLMPEYFRSQRQIIIDSEKLLAEKQRTPVQEFKDRSNSLGHDQKTLRLRYGQFMGEEAEEGIGMEAAHPGEEEEEDPLKQFGHQHDKDNEHNLVSEQKEEPKKNPLQEFMHQHDNTEEATFFVQSVKAKLRAALTLMWDAELHLRMADPKTSLPYQYKILKLLKEISQDSRVYVHRSGFDPPPIKEEKRLTADLSDVRGGQQRRTATSTFSLPRVRAALHAIGILLRDSTQHDDALIASIGGAAPEVAGKVLSDPQQLQTLEILRQTATHTRPSASVLRDLQRRLYTLLPEGQPVPGAATYGAHALRRNWEQYYPLTQP